jgi:hypothetical protein
MINYKAGHIIFFWKTVYAIKLFLSQTMGTNKLECFPWQKYSGKSNLNGEHYRDSRYSVAPGLMNTY